MRDRVVREFNSFEDSVLSGITWYSTLFKDPKALQYAANTTPTTHHITITRRTIRPANIRKHTQSNRTTERDAVRQRIDLFSL